MTPLLGFGTASVLGRHSRRDSARAIRAALALGIRHFDTARSYGWGEAEVLLGQIVRSVPREELVIVSKCGLVPVRQSAVLRLAKAVARQLVAWVPGLRSRVVRLASSQAVQPTGTYDLEILKRSLRDSLVNLDTAYLDVLLLHNFEVGKPGLDAVVEWMRGLKAKGIIRNYGFSVESDLLPALAWLSDTGLLGSVVIQTPLVNELLHLPARFAAVEFIVHSPFRYLEQENATHRSVTFADVLRKVASTVQCRAVVTSMFSQHHREENVAAARMAFFDDYRPLDSTD